MAFLTIITLFWSTIVLFIDVGMMHSTYRQWDSQYYQAVSGRVVDSQVTVHHGKGTSYSAQIDYTFEVAGREFTNNRIRYGATTSDPASANAMVNAHPDGSAIQVYYNPRRPEESLLSPGLNGTDLTMALFLTPFNAVMFSLWRWVGGALRRRMSPQVAGGVRIIRGGMATRARLPAYDAVLLGLGTAGGLGFFWTIFLAIVAHMNPPVSFVSLVIGVTVAAGLGVYFRRRHQENSGIFDLVIDPSARTLGLPQTHGRRQAMTIGLGDVKSLTVEKIAHRGGRGGTSYSYAPTLHLRGEKAGPQKLGDWTDKLKAEGFAEWLRKELGIWIGASW
jgi:Protein of unknown function (DUF3592)